MTPKKIAIYISSAVVAIALIFIIIFSGSGVVFKTGPNKNAEAIGNGGMAVLKGEYLYFVNGYVPASDNFNKNKGSKIYQGAIYRVKAEGTTYNVFNGNLEVNYGGLTNEENGSTNGAQRLVSKIAGFERSQLFIFGDKLYFTSPSTTKNLSSGATNITSIDIWQINLNGSGLKRIYTIENPNSDSEVADFAAFQVNFFKNGNDVYGIFYDGADKLAIYKNGKKHVEKTQVTQLAMPLFKEDYSGLDNRSEQQLVYIIDNKVESYIFPNANSSEFKTTSVEFTRSRTPKLIAVDKGILYYEFNYSVSTNVYYLNASEITDIIAGNTKNSRELATGVYDSYVANGTFDLPSLIAYSSSTNEISVVKSGADFRFTVGESGATILFADKTNVIYSSGTSLYIANYATGVSRSLTGSTTVSFFDMPASFDGIYVYYFKEVSKEVENDDGETETVTGIYLERVNTLVEGEDGFAKQEISSRLEKHYNEPEDEE